MANEILFSAIPNKTFYFLVFSRTGQVWNTNSSAFESYLTVNLANYAISAGQQGSNSSYYEGTFPSAIIAGTYQVSAKQQLGGSPAESDPSVAGGNYEWNGTATFQLADVVTSGQFCQIAPLRLARGTMIQNFPVYLVSSTDHVTPLTGAGTNVSGQIARDGGGFGALQSGAFTETGLGFYSCQALTSGDLLANTIKVVFSAPGADARPMFFVLQRTSGQG